MVLSACGQKGPLYIEPKAEVNKPKTEQVKPVSEKKTASEDNPITETTKK